MIRVKADKSSLNIIQNWMKHNLMFPRDTSTAEVDGLLLASKRLSAEQRLGVYQRSYYLRILKCMREQFPALCYALGDELFNDFARDYLQCYPSESYTLYALGTRFPDYLQQTRPDKDLAEQEQWIDFMLDLATYELDLFLMFDAPGHEDKAYATITTADDDLQLQSCFKLGCYDFPVAGYYHDVKDDRAPEFPAAKKSMIAMVRNNYRTHTFALKHTHYILLKAMSEGHSVSQALATVADKTGIPLTSIIQSWHHPQGIRQRWIIEGYFGVKQ